VTFIAYPAKPPLPGWIWTAGALLVGWIVAAAATLLLYMGTDGLGAIAHGYSYPGATPYWSSGVNQVSLNDGPYPDSGLWTLFANVTVVALVLVLTTVATALWMRRSYEYFSEGRLALVLLMTGWLPSDFPARPSMLLPGRRTSVSPSATHLRPFRRTTSSLRCVRRKRKGSSSRARPTPHRNTASSRECPSALS
jgi:hypothetical protein